MRFSRTLLALPAVLACAAAVGCHQAQHVKYNPDGTAEAVEAPVYDGVVKHEPAPQAVEVIKEPAPAPAPVKEAAPAPKPVAPVAKPEPKPEAKPEVKPAAKPEAKPAGAQTHVVAKGDTLQKISQKYYGTTKKWPAIMKANNMKDDKIRVGQKLVLPEVK